jgi:hypothetical protein
MGRTIAMDQTEIVGRPEQQHPPETLRLSLVPDGERYVDIPEVLEPPSILDREDEFVPAIGPFARQPVTRVVVRPGTELLFTTRLKAPEEATLAEIDAISNAIALSQQPGVSQMFVEYGSRGICFPPKI